jgi:hypothetical protein
MRGGGRDTYRPRGDTRKPPLEHAEKPIARRGRSARQWSEWPRIGWRCACFLLGSPTSYCNRFLAEWKHTRAGVVVRFDAEAALRRHLAR